MVFAFLIRFYNLTSIPEGFDQTEAAFGYNAYSISKTGRDEYGKFLPLVLVSVGDYKLSNFSYWEIPFIELFGLDVFSVKISVVTASMISLVLIYLITSDLIKNKKLSLLTLLLVSIAPWHIVMSRMAYDPMIAFMWYLFSVFLFIRWFRKDRLYLLLLSVITLSFSISTYYSVWLLFPFTIAAYWIFILKKETKIKKLVYLTLILLIPVVMLIKLLQITSGQRLYQDSTFQINVTPLIGEQIREDQRLFPMFLTRLFHNKLTFYPLFISQNLFKNLSADFLFLNGDKIDKRFTVPYSGVLYLVTAPFLFLGLLSFWKNYPVKKNLFIFGLVFLIFLGSSFSEFGSETERTLFAVPIFSFLIAYGLTVLVEKVHKNYISAVIIGTIWLLFIYNMAYFNHQYFWHGNVHQPWGRNFGVQEMIGSIKLMENRYEKVVIPDSTYIFFYFYNKTDPKIAWEESKNVGKETNFLGFHLRSKIGNYITMPIECPAAGKLHVLYVCTGTKIPRNGKIIKIIPYRDNQPAFIFLEFTVTPVSGAPPVSLSFMDKYGIINADENINWRTESEIR